MPSKNKRKTNLLKSDDLLMRRPQNHDLLLRFWSSKSLFAILSYIHYQFQSVLDSQVLCTSHLVHFCNFYKFLSFYDLGFSTALKAHNQLVWLLLQRLSTSYFCAINAFAPLHHQAWLQMQHNPWCLRSSPLKQKRLFLYYYYLVYCTIIKSTQSWSKKITWRCT